jgi:hypothetical protein
MKLRARLLHFYPLWWRERYGDEFEALLEEGLRSPLDVLDILLGALDAHLELSQETNWRFITMNNKLRTTILIVFASYIAFIVAGFSLSAFMDDSPLVPLVKSNPALTDAWLILEAGSVIALFAIAIGGTPLAWTVIRRTFTSHRTDLRLLLVPLYAFLAFALYTFFLISASFEWIHIQGFEPVVQNGVMPPVNRALLTGEILVFVLGAIASTVAVWKVVSHTDVEQEAFSLIGKQKTIKVYEFAFGPAAIAALAMLVTFLATVVWGWLAFTLRPDLFTGNMGVMMTSTRGSFAFTLTLMAIASLTACLAVFRGRSSRREL